MSLRYRTLLPVMALFLFAFPLSAQTVDDWSGRWEGTLELPGASLDMIIKLEQADGEWKGTLDIPLQRVKDMALADLVIDGSNFSFSLPEAPGNANYSGEWSEEGQIAGEFRQMGGQRPLTLIKEDAAAAAALQAKIEQIKVLVDSFRQGAEVPGMGLGIIYKDEVQLADGFGHRNVEEELPATSSTLFAIGSSSKAFTSMGLGLLVDAGELDWNEPIQTYLTDFKLHDQFATQEMTATDLVTHRSGLPRHDYLWYATPFDRQELYARLPYLEPSASFRSKWQYQNLMFMTAGVLTEKLSGGTWEEYIDENIFTPLGMETAMFSVDNMEAADDFAYGYGNKDDEITRLPYHNIDAIGPAGSINASVEDMLKWVELHLGDGTFQGQHFISGGTLQKMHQPHMAMENPLLPLPSITHPAYGLGWFIYDLDGLYIVEHGGNIDGFSALVFMIPEEGFGMVCLTNRNGTPLGYVLAYTIADVLLDREYTDWYGTVFDSDDDEEEEAEAEEEEEDIVRRVEGTSYQHALEAYTGTYTHPGYGDVLVVQEGGQLVASYYKLQFPLNHWHFETFKGEDESIGAEIEPTFVTNRAGQVIGMDLQVEIMLPDIRFEKQPEERLTDPAFLESLVGVYELEGGMTVTIEFSGDHLTATVPGQPLYDLEPLQGTEFKLKQLSGFTMEFLLVDDKPVALISHQPNGHFRAERSE